MHRVGIIGCGMVHCVHADAISHTDNAKVVALSGGANTVLTAVADIIPERAIAAAEKYHCDWYTRICKEDHVGGAVPVHGADAAAGDGAGGYGRRLSGR